MTIVAILCTDPIHPVNAWLQAWGARCRTERRAQVTIYRDMHELAGGDFLFLVSCHQIVDHAVRSLYRHTLVLHASDLPRGRGMSPHIWQIVHGAHDITLTLLNAVDQLDAGDIWCQQAIAFDGTELHDEINQKLFDAEVTLMDWALLNCATSVPRSQSGSATHYRKRTPADSQIDPTRPLQESFDLLRVADPNRYPAWFELRGQTYQIRIEKVPSK